MDHQLTEQSFHDLPLGLGPARCRDRDMIGGAILERLPSDPPTCHTAAIFVLPPEIIHQIFREYQKSFVHRTFKKSKRNQGGWIRIAHICRYLRQVAFSCPELWTHLRLPGSPYAAESINSFHAVEWQLQNAGTVPLTFEVSLTNHRLFLFPSIHEAIVNTIVSNVSRTRQLVITGDKAPVEDLLDQLVSPAPMIESLSISGLHIPIPSDLFAGCTPKLQSLELSNCSNILWRSPLLIGSPIKHLKLRRVQNMGVHVNWAGLRGVLETLQTSLETLVLDNYLEADSEELDTSVPVLHLPNLKEGTFAGKTHHVLGFFSSVTVPGTAKLSIRYRHGAFWGQELHDFYMALKAFRSGEDLQPTHLLISQNEVGASMSRFDQSTTTTLRGWKHPIKFMKNDEMSPVDPPAFEIIFHHTEQPDSGEQAFFPVDLSQNSPGIDCSVLESVDIRGFLATPSTFWDTLSRSSCAPVLVKARIHGLDPAPLLSCFRADALALRDQCRSQNEGKRDLYSRRFHALRTLIFREVDFTSSSDGGTEVDDVLRGCSNHSAFALGRRLWRDMPPMGVPLDVRFVNCCGCLKVACTSAYSPDI